MEQITQERGRSCASEIPPITVNFDHLSDAEKFEAWRQFVKKEGVVVMSVAA